MNLPYLRNFLSETEANLLLEACERLEFVKRVNPRNPKQFLKRGTLTFQDANVIADKAQMNGDVTIFTMREAPSEVAMLRDKLSEYAGRTVNYLSFNKYPDGGAGIGFHNHKEDLAIWTPVFLVSVGSPRFIHVREIDNHKACVAQELAHGSLYEMPPALNATHQHAVLPEKHVHTVRYSINAKCLPVK